MSVEREFSLEAKRVARTQTAGNGPELAPGLKHFVPHPRAGFLVAGNVNLEAVFTGISRARDQDVLKPADGAASHPIKFHGGEVRIRKLL